MCTPRTRPEHHLRTLAYVCVCAQNSARPGEGGGCRRQCSLRGVQQSSIDLHKSQGSVAAICTIEYLDFVKELAPVNTFRTNAPCGCIHEKQGMYVRMYVHTYVRRAWRPSPPPHPQRQRARERERDARALPCKTHDAFRCAWTVCSNCASCANLSSSSAIAPGLQLSLRQQARRQRARGGEQTLLSAQFATRSTCRMHTARFGRAPRRINQQPMPLHACQCTNNPCPFGNSTCTYVVKLAAFVTETGPRARHASERHIRRPRYVRTYLRMYVWQQPMWSCRMSEPPPHPPTKDPPAKQETKIKIT